MTFERTISTSIVPAHSLLKPSEVATLFGVSPKTVYGWTTSGGVMAVRFCGIVRIPREAVLTMLKPSTGEAF